jgi:predicted nucleic acid-binding protein
VIAAAIASGAALVVSGDADLLSLGSHEGIAIVSATEAVRRLDIGKG